MQNQRTRLAEWQIHVGAKQLSQAAELDACIQPLRSQKERDNNYYGISQGGAEKEIQDPVGDSGMEGICQLGLGQDEIRGEGARKGE